MAEYDPAWDMPLVNWQQQGSFTDGQVPPAVAPDAGTPICIGPVAREWLYVILGALDQLRNPSTWIVADDAAMFAVLRAVDKLKEIVAVSEGCVPPVEMRLTSECVLQYSNDGGATWIDTTDWVSNFGNCVRANIPPPVPVNPPDNPPGQEACNIATWLAQQILIKAAAAQVANRDAGNVLSNLVANVISSVFGNNPLISFLTEATNVLYQESQPYPNADLSAAATDAGLLADLICAILSAIQSVGYVDGTNFAQCATNIAAVAYPAHTWVPTMLAHFWTNLGLGAIQIMQSEGTVTDGDCSGCSGVEWCHYFDFSLNNGGWEEYYGGGGYGTYDAGNGWISQNVGALSQLVIGVQMGASAHITEVQVHYHSHSGNTSGQPHLAEVQHPYQVTNIVAANLPFADASNSPVWDSCAPVGTGTAVVIDLVGGATGLPVPVTTIQGVQIRGTGVNPFRGFGPCVVGP